MRYEQADARLDREAPRNHGAFARDELKALGYSDRALDTRIAQGRLEVVHPSVYVPRGYPRTALTDINAAVKWAGDGALASHRSAGGELYELDGVPRGIVEISLYAGSRRPGVKLHRLRPEDRPSRRFVKGIPCTGVERTLRDLCASLTPVSAGLAIDDALRRKLTTLDRLQQEGRRTCARGVSGCRVFRQLLALRDDRDERVRSKVETKLLRISKKVRIERVASDFHVPDGRRNYYLDFAFPRRMVGVELHSLRWHFGDDKWKRDMARERRLTILGWTIVKFSYDDVVFTPDSVLAEIEEVLRTRPVVR